VGESAAFMVNRASFKLDRFNVYTSFVAASTTVTMIRATYCTHNTVTMTNLSIQVEGNVSFGTFNFRSLMLWTRASISTFKILISVSIVFNKIDLYKTSNLLNYIPFCNYPEAVLDHNITIKDTLLFNSQPRTKILKSLIKIFGDAQTTVSRNT